MLDLYVKRGIRFSLRDKRLVEITEVEITRVDCIRLFADGTSLLFIFFFFVALLVALIQVLVKINIDVIKACYF